MAFHGTHDGCFPAAPSPTFDPASGGHFSDDGMKSVPVVPVRTIDESELLEVAFKFIVTDQEVPMIFCYRLQQYFNNAIVKGQ